jgi:predicted secreted hydrolase
VIDRRALLQAGFGGMALMPLGSATARRAAASSGDNNGAGNNPGAAAGRAPAGTAPLAFPRDHGAHPDHRIEWWYLTGWLWPGGDGGPNADQLADPNADAAAGAIGFQVTFFRARTGIGPTTPGAFAAHQLVISHAALADPAYGRLLHDQRIARTGFGIASVAEGDTDVAVDRWSLRRAPDGTYAAVIDAHGFSLRLKASPRQPLLLQGDAGYSRKGTGTGESSFYISQPHLAITAELTRGSAQAGAGAMAAQALHGEAWLDHEWSNGVLGPQAAGWDWIGMNLRDGGALTAFRIRAKAGAMTGAAAGAAADPLFAYASLRDVQGNVQRFGRDAVRFTALRNWTSPRTRASYPVAVRIQVGDRTFDTQPLLDDQELDSTLSTGAVYWEGASQLLEHGRVAGRGYLEMTGYVAPLRL